MKGLFVVFEGIDGSGKGTILRHAYDFLVAKGIKKENLILTAEPTPGFYGKKVRELLSTDVDPKVNAMQFLDLYVADRKEHIEKVLKPAIDSGKIILCDRYKYSTFTYQQIQGIPIEKISVLHKSMVVPNLVFILDVPADVALKRISSDSKRNTKEVFEKKDFLENVREGFLKSKKIFPNENIVIVDSSKSIEKVSAEINGVLWKILKK
ncbi:MAG: dTMP kinase [Candidatus Diapherotrites archaeon CG11_big_fil_rev_8_21_14_0_20_37_9]|nr:MAG: dTMP kinase [Candidatus Diapherotrites archaeon CG11_big_fil_rev_8_21_14_0_20_37_9]